MFIELQLASVPFTQFLRNMLRQRLAMQPCIDDTFPYMGETFMVDYLHIDRTTSLRTPNGSASVNQTGEAGAVPITARQTQIAQRLIVHLTTLEALRATSRGEPPRDVTPSRMVFEVVFSIQLTVVAGAAQLVMNFVDILPFDIVARAIPPSELDRIRAAVRMRVPAITSTLNLGALT